MSAVPPVELLSVCNGGLELRWVGCEPRGAAPDSMVRVELHADGMAEVSAAVGVMQGRYVFLGDGVDGGYTEFLCDPRDISLAWTEDRPSVAAVGLRMFARLCALLAEDRPTIDLRGVPLALVVTLQRFAGTGAAS